MNDAQSFNSPSLKRRTKSLTQGVTAALTQQIESGVLKKDDKLPSEFELIQQHGVSRSVIREAISHLQAAGLIETRHGIGSFVLDCDHAPNFRIDPALLVTIQDILDVLQLRQSIESAAAGIAALKRNDDDLALLRALLAKFKQIMDADGDTADVDFRFHQAIAKATQNQYFAEFMSYLGQTVIPRARMKIAKEDHDVHRHYLERVHYQHEEIFKAIESQNPLLASSAMQMHLNNSAQHMRRLADSAAD